MPKKMTVWGRETLLHSQINLLENIFKNLAVLWPTRLAEMRAVIRKYLKKILQCYGPHVWLKCELLLGHRVRCGEKQN